MIAIDAVIEACRLMGVPFSVPEEPPAGFLHGLASGGCHPTLGVYMPRHDMEHAHKRNSDVWAWALHELSHVVWWHPDSGADVCEQPLIAWEYAVSRHFRIPNFWSCIFTADTRIVVDGDDREVRDWARPQRAAWFAEARQECVRRGALTPDFRPTWKRPIFRLDDNDDGWETL